MRKDALARAIPKQVKEAVAERDSLSTEGWPCCIWCGRPAPSMKPYAFSCAHFIGRAQGGLGCEENILTLCPACHNRYDQTTDREEMREYFRNYLKRRYDHWDEASLVYRKDSYER